MKPGRGKPSRPSPPQRSGPASLEFLLQKARTHHRAHQLAEAQALYRQALQLSPPNATALHYLGLIEHQFGRYPAAVELFDRALASNPNYAEAHFNRGNTLYVLQQYPAALEAYNRALQLNPAHAEAFHNRGSALHTTGQYQAAFESYDRAVLLKPDYAEAWHNRASALHALGQYPAALDSEERALQLHPAYLDAWFNRGNLHFLLQQYPAAIESYEQVIRLSPQHASAHHNRGSALHALGQFHAAIESFDRALEVNPAYAEAHCNRANAFYSLGDFAAALESSDRAIALAPNFALAHSNRSNALCAMNRFEAALASSDRAVQLDPNFAEAWNNRGNALSALHRYQEALESCDRALQINPSFVDAYYNRGNNLQALKQYPAALESYDAALRINPQHMDSYNNRGGALHAMRQFQAAVESFDQAILLRPDYAEAHNNRASALHGLKQYPAALESYRQAWRLKPGYDYLPGMCVNLRRILCDWENIETESRDLEAAILRGEKACQPFEMLAISDSAAIQQLAASLYTRDKHPPRTTTPIPRRAGRDRIRIGYFSADYFNHAMSYLMAEVYELHDRSRFEIVGFSFGPDHDDDMRRRISTAMDRFLDVQSTADPAVAQLARELEIDIAVDLNGFTRDARPGIFAERAAPIHVNYLGYPGTMGAGYIDYLIADANIVPESSRAHYSEQIVTLPGTYQANDSQRPVSTRSFTRAEQGLPESAFVFCSFNNPYKITPAVFDSWMRILREVDGSVLWLYEENSWTSANLRDQAARRGVAPERLIFARPLPLAEHLARHPLADLFLDTSPYNAHTTASDALWTGLPVLTRIGETFAGRVAASLIRAIGLPELVTSTAAEYEALAVQLARSPERLRTIRERLLHNRATAPLFDSRAFTRHLEAAYTAMLDRYDAGLPPAPISIDRTSS